MIFNRVVLPHPDGPTMLAKVPRPISRLSESITVNWPSPLGLGNILVSPSICTALGRMSFPLRHWDLPPGERALLPRAEHDHLDRNHQQHKTYAPSEHHIGADSLKPVHELLANAATDAEGLAYERDLP